MKFMEAWRVRRSQVGRALRDKTAQQAVQDAAAVGLRVALDAGLTTTLDREPTQAQAKLAALHAREDAAAIIALQSALLVRVNKAVFWGRFCGALLVIVLLTKA